MSPRMAAQPVRMPQKARSKYRAVKETVDGITFHSKAEARRYAEIKLLEKAGEIWELELQPKFPLKVPSTSGYLSRALQATAGDGLCQIGLYIADFKYHDRAGTVPYVVEDVKGHATPLYKWKKKHVEAQYGVTIVEIRRRG